VLIYIVNVRHYNHNNIRQYSYCWITTFGMCEFFSKYELRLLLIEQHIFHDRVNRLLWVGFINCEKPQLCCSWLYLRVVGCWINKLTIHTASSVTKHVTLLYSLNNHVILPKCTVPRYNICLYTNKYYFKFQITCFGEVNWIIIKDFLSYIVKEIFIIIIT
jgi:hypothetical protein